MLSGPIKRAAVPALAVRAVSNNTGDGMRKIANDVTSLTQVWFLVKTWCFHWLKATGLQAWFIK